MKNDFTPAGSGYHAQNDGGSKEALLPVSGVTQSPLHLLSGRIRTNLPATVSPAPNSVREANGRFKRGAPSPNPSGRATVAPEVKEAARAHTAEMLAVLVEVATDGAAPPAARVAAANAVLDRGHGKPTASVEAKVANLDLGELHLAALRDLSRSATPQAG